MTIVGHIELNGFINMSKNIGAEDVAPMYQIVNSWAKTKIYQIELMDAVTAPENLLYTSGGWTEMSTAEIEKITDKYITFNVSIDFDDDENEQNFLDEMDASDWHEWIQVPAEDPTAPFDYIEFRVEYDYTNLNFYKLNN